MDIRDHAALDRAGALLPELIELTKKGGRAGGRSPALSACVHRHAVSLRDAVERLRKALDEAGPAPQWLKEREPLYMRLSEHKELQEIARLLGHYGVLEDDLFALTRKLAAQVGDTRVSDAIKELVWIDRNTRWARLRPETIRVLRPMIGPFSDDPDIVRWWADKGGVPPFRSPETEKAKKEQETKGEEKPKKRTRKKTA